MSVSSHSLVALLAITRQMMVYEAVIGGLVVVILVSILVLSVRRRSATPGAAEAPMTGHGSSGAEGLPAGLGERDEPGEPALRDEAEDALPAFIEAGHTKVSAAGTTGMAGGGPEPVDEVAVGSPPPGTPATWLPDPGGSPDTLRFWDGAGWTQYIAQRS